MWGKCQAMCMPAFPNRDLRPDEPLYFPRVGVITFSCDELDAPLFAALQEEGPAVRLFNAAHELLQKLGASLGCPFPEYE